MCVRTLYARLFNVVFSGMLLFEKEDAYCFIIYVDRLVCLSVSLSVRRQRGFRLLYCKPGLLYLTC